MEKRSREYFRLRNAELLIKTVGKEMIKDSFETENSVHDYVILESMGMTVLYYKQMSVINLFFPQKYK